MKSKSPENSMNDMTMEELLQAMDNMPDDQNIEPGMKIKGSIVEMNEDIVFLDIGAKSEAVLKTTELLDESNKLNAKIGDTIEVRFCDTIRYNEVTYILDDTGRMLQY